MYFLFYADYHKAPCETYRHIPQLIERNISCHLKELLKEFPGDPVGRTWTFHFPGPRFNPSSGELRACKPCDAARKQTNKQGIIIIVWIFIGNNKSKIFENIFVEFYNYYLVVINVTEHMLKIYFVSPPI